MELVDFAPALETVQELFLAGVARIPLVLAGILIFFLFYFIAAPVKGLVERLTRRARRSRSAAILFGRLAQWFTIFLGFMVALVIILPNFTPTKVISFLGIGGVAIGFAFRDILQNFLAGILLLATEPFRLGDQIIVNEFEGTVTDIETRATTIKTYDGCLVVIPNADLFTDSVIVNTAFQMRRSEYDIGIGYGDDLIQAKELIREAIRSVPEVTTDPAPEALVVDFAASGVIVRARWWTRPTKKDVLSVFDQVLTAIKITLDEHGIDIPYQTQTILFHDQTDETDGNRMLQREGWPAPRGRVPKARNIAGSLRALGALHLANEKAYANGKWEASDQGGY